MPPTEIALTIPHGTATAAFEDSSAMWTLESKEPGSYHQIGFDKGGKSELTNGPQWCQEAKNKRESIRPAVN